MMAAPFMTPLQPKCPKVPVLGGMYGCQFDVSMNFSPAMTTIRMIATFSATMKLLAPEEPRTPTYSSHVMSGDDEHLPAG